MKLAYYPGCSAEGSAIEYDLSTRKTALLLGTELQELEDWNCCGATSAHNTNKILSWALPARNLAIAEKNGMDFILAPCAACYSRLHSTEVLARRDKVIREQIQDVIEMEFTAQTSTISVLEWLDRQVGIEKIKGQIKKPLKGMKAACYYGCLLVRPVEYTGFDDPEDPQSMDRIVKALGAETVEWSHKSECCGAALATSRPEVGVKMIYEIIKNAKNAGAECLVTACPLCMMNLDMRQAGALKAAGEKIGMPVYYVTELVALAAGVSPAEIGISKHFVEADSYITSLAAKVAALATSAPAKGEKDAGKKENVDSGEDAQDLQKKIDAMVQAFNKNPDKIASRLIKDQERAKLLGEIIARDEKKIGRLAELMVTDKEKACKAAEAFVTGELKKREKSSS
ncbi:MAG: CoB--CoM heterodisulfide reductase iron-sulfur subunit B family protein [Syntrophomonadaceae bacterium]|jgi:heterodisulfide reductase subunit B